MPEQEIDIATQDDTASLLEELMRLVMGAGPPGINFEDLSGVSYEIPDLRLPFELHIHTCEFCLFAKANRESHRGCIRNKLAVNRLAVRRRAGFTGQCHLGLTDIVEPLLFKEQVLGVFYFGSVVVAGTEEEARKRVVRYCDRHGFDAQPYLKHLETAPRLESAELAACKDRLRLVVALAGRIVAAHTPIPHRFRTERGAQYLTTHGMSPMVRRAMHFIQQRFSRPLRVREVAENCNCHPDYLSRVFHREAGVTVTDFIARTRTDRARYLLELDRYSLDEIAYQTGFHDQSHFARCFKRFLGMTPGEYRAHGKTSGARTHYENFATRALSIYPIER